MLTLLCCLAREAIELGEIVWSCWGEGEGGGRGEGRRRREREREMIVRACVSYYYACL